MMRGFNVLAVLAMLLLYSLLAGCHCSGTVSLERRLPDGTCARADAVAWR